MNSMLTHEHLLTRIVLLIILISCTLVNVVELTRRRSHEKNIKLF
uniref:Hypotheticial protein n=1 Tax=Schistosoma japonicum TaxID=6182 RepID=C7TXY2_SCHJA|nr:hypotheticial protein [Schistosoma japonicum]